ncbi:MAG: MFS transporter [Phycisphaerales bacterium JB039]
MLRRLNPFRDLPNPREVWAWGMYDLANQSFTLLIITLLFSRYVEFVVVGPDAEGDTGAGKLAWSLIHGGSLLLVVVLSPVVGAIGDLRGWRKQILVFTGVLCACLTCGLGLVGAGAIALAAALYMPANICYQIGENFLASFLPDVSTSRTIGRISAIGWMMGYVGALLLLIAAMGGMLLFGREDTAAWRPFFIFAGLWFLIFMIPATLILRDDDPVADRSDGLLRQSFGRLADTVRQASRYRQLAKFLLAFFIYGFGVQVIIGFASIIAAGYGFEKVQLVVFVAQITITAGIAAALTMTFQDRIGAKATVMIYLGVWILSCAGLIAIKLIWPSQGPQWPLWVVGNGLGFGLGGIGTASRSMVGRFTPRQKRAEFFGLWGFVYKLAGALGVLSFGAVAKLFGDLASLLLLGSFFIIGLLLILPVNEVAGVCAARRVERQWAGKRTAKSEKRT